MTKVTNPKLLDNLTFLSKKHLRKSDVHNLPIISNVRASKDGYVLNVRMYNRKAKKYDKFVDFKITDKQMIEVLEFQMNYRSEYDYAMMSDEAKAQPDKKMDMKLYNAVKFNKQPAQPKPKSSGDFNVIVMDETGTSSGQMDIGGVHDLLSAIL